MIPVSSVRTLSEAYAILHQRPAGLRVLAGGTDFMVAVNARIGLDRIGHVLDIWNVDELRGIAVAASTLRIGALTTYTALMESPEIARHLPALAAVSREVGAWAIQNRGTIGGNVCNASPAGDSLSGGNGRSLVDGDLRRARKLGREVEVHTASGDWSAEVVRIAHEGNYDLIILPLPTERPEGSLQPWDTTIDRILRDAHCRVFLASPPSIPHEVDQEPPAGPAH